MDFFDVVTTTRAIRRYRPDPIPEDDLARIFFAATRAPSGSNSQPFHFLVLRDGSRASEARQLLGQAFRSAWTAKRADDGYDSGTSIAATIPLGRPMGNHGPVRRRPLASLVSEDAYPAPWAQAPEET